MSLRINGERIFLKIPEMKNAKAICKYANDKAIARYTTIPHPYKLKHAKNFVKRVKQKMKKKESYEFSIVLKETGEIIGGIGLINISKFHKNAELGYWLAKKYWGQGLMSEAMKLILDFGFNKLKLHKIYARVYKPNKRSSHLLEKFGFKLEGNFRKHLKGRFSNKWYDELRYGLLREEWKSI
ncbi:MAG: GNAT family protein [Candidatus Aenigmatarchaeota archaeon]